MNTFTLVCGLPRSGKSTWIENNKGDAIVVSNDWIRENILGHKYSEPANAIVWTIADATIRILLGQGKDVIYDGINLTRDVRKFFIDIAEIYKSRVRIVYVETPSAVCVMRNKNKEKLPDGKIERMGRNVEMPNESEYDEFVKVTDCYTEQEAKDSIPF
jgi:predicted kinase